MKKIVDLLSELSFFQGLTSEDLAFIAGCGKNVIFEEKHMIAKPGDVADEFYIIRQGRVALILESPSHKPFIFQTLGENDLVGLSWLIPPYRWTISAKAIQMTKAIAINGACLREKCEKDHTLGFKLMKRLVQELVAREEAAIFHLLDVYGTNIR